MTQPNEHIYYGSIGYGSMSLVRHDPRDVAGLIYESAPKLFDLMFGSQAIKVLTDLVQRSHNRFSYQYIWIAEIDQQVIGMAILVPAAHINDVDDYREILNFSQQLWLKLVKNLILRHVLQHDYPAGTFYIGNLAVAAKYRNQGIGRQLLSQCISDITSASSIFVSVDIDNLRAQRLYELLGFQVVSTKTIRLLGTSIGSRVLSLSYPD
jgi:ribosomal protein S18 acetylase RimI-like enzyme